MPKRRRWCTSCSLTRPARCSARAGQVAVQRVDRALVAGKRVDGCHVATCNAAGLVQNLCNGCQTICRARRIGDKDFPIVGVIIDAHDKHASVVLGWCRHDNFLRTSVNVSLCRIGSRCLQFLCRLFGSVHHPLRRCISLNGCLNSFSAVGHAISTRIDSPQQVRSGENVLQY